MGVHGGASELVSGVKGVVQKPEEKKKVAGDRGLAVGIGEGVVGAVAAPITATLKAGTDIAQGASITAENRVEEQKQI